MKLDGPLSAAPAAISEAAPALPAALPWLVPRLVGLLGQRLTTARMLEALPHAMDAQAPEAVLGAARRLGLAPRAWTGGSHRLPEAALPALWERPDGPPALIIGRSAAYFDVETAPGAPTVRVPARALPGRLHVFAGAAEAEAAARRPLLVDLLAGHAGAIATLLLLSLLASCASIGLGLVVMVAFDMVVPTGEAELLALLAAGVALAVAAEFGARLLTARGIGSLGEAAERRILSAVFGKVMRLPWRAVAAQDPAAQVLRLREIEAARELFAGPLPQLVLQLPMVAMILLAVWLLAGPVVLVPLGILALQLVCGALLLPVANAAEQAAGALATERRRMMLETVSHAPALRMTGVEAVWLERLRGVSAAAAAAQARAARTNGALETLASVTTPLAAAGMASLGAVLVIGGSLSAGALVAAIMLGWRLLAPMQSFVVASARSGRVRDAALQLHRLEQLEEERRPPADAPPPAPPNTTLRFEDVVFRPASAAPAVLAGASLAVPPGACVAITGPSGAGKSTLLRLALGLLQPQAGTISLGGVNIAQFDPQALRARIAYLPQRPQLIYGTVAQNLRLAAPTAGDADLEDACEAAGILERVLAMPQGFATRLDDLGKDRLSHSLRHGLALSQALLRRPDLLLLDDPTRGLDPEREARLAQLLDRLHGRVGVVVATQRDWLIRRSDTVLVLDRGRLMPASPSASVPDRS